MKLTVFQSDKGDCLLLTSKDNKRVLVDGGMSWSYRDHVAATLGAIGKKKQKLDLVYVSHIDEDHISGIVQLFDDLVEWRVFDYQQGSGNSDCHEPERPRPPAVSEVWHNSFGELLGQDPGPVEELFAASAAVLEGGSNAALQHLAMDHRNLASGAADAIRLRNRLSRGQLHIPVNKAFGGRLALAKSPAQVVKLGSLRMSVLAPAAVDLENLRPVWDDWLRKNQDDLTDIQHRMREDVERLATDEVEALRLSIELGASKLGRRSEVTPPNLASLMLLVEEGPKSLLLTGDGHQADILAGLERARKIDAESGLHVDVLKVQHHGSENNLDEEFCRRISADHYVFCGNGFHENPDLQALEAIIASRLGSGPERTTNPGSERPFKLWFNSSEAATSPGAKEHMAKIEVLVKERTAKSEGQMSFFFLNDHSFDLAI